MRLTAIGEIHSCFTEKFGTPRQPGLVTSALAELQLYTEFSDKEAIRGLSGFSHLWLIFQFHQTQKQGWKPLVRPPRLGGNQKVGVFASRSMYRPNSLGLSACRLEKIEHQQKNITLHLSGIDLIDGTPIFDIKPYLPYSDSLSEATSGYAPAPITLLAIHFSEQAEAQCHSYRQTYPHLTQLITQVLEQDPRPAFHNETTRIYGIKLYQLNIQWTYNNQHITVLSIDKIIN